MGLDKGKGIMIEYDSDSAKKSERVDKGKGVIVEYDKSVVYRDEVNEHEESEEEIVEGDWLIKDPFKREEGKSKGESNEGRNGKKKENLPKFRSDVKNNHKLHIGTIFQKVTYTSFLF